jgi:hypothetical protein
MSADTLSQLGIRQVAMTWGEIFRTIGMAIVIAVVGGFALWIVANELSRF